MAITIELLDYAETQGKENIRHHFETADYLNKQASTTLAVLLALSGGALAYAVKLLDASLGMALCLAVASVALYLFGLCAVLVTQCLVVKDFPNQANEPDNLLQDGYSLEQIRRAELQNLQTRIRQASQRNAFTTRWLNRVRLWATFTPMVLGLNYLLATYAVAHLF